MLLNGNDYKDAFVQQSKHEAAIKGALAKFLLLLKSINKNIVMSSFDSNRRDSDEKNAFVAENSIAKVFEIEFIWFKSL